MASPHGVVAVGGVVLDRRNPPGSIVHTGLDITASAIRAELVAAGGVVPARHGLYLSSSPATITAHLHPSTFSISCHVSIYYEKFSSFSSGYFLVST